MWSLQREDRLQYHQTGGAQNKTTLNVGRFYVFSQLISLFDSVLGLGKSFEPYFTSEGGVVHLSIVPSGLSF